MRLQMEKLLKMLKWMLYYSMVKMGGVIRRRVFPILQKSLWQTTTDYFWLGWCVWIFFPSIYCMFIHSTCIDQPGPQPWLSSAHLFNPGPFSSPKTGVTWFFYSLSKLSSIKSYETKGLPCNLLHNRDGESIFFLPIQILPYWLLRILYGYDITNVPIFHDTGTTKKYQYY